MENSSPSTFRQILQLACSFAAAFVRGPFYIYLLLVSFSFFILFLAIFSSVGGFNLINFLLQLSKPLLISLGVPENASIRYSGGIPDWVLEIFIIICTIAGFLGNFLLKAWYKRELEPMEKAILFVKFCMAANIGSSVIVFLFGMWKPAASVADALVGALFYLFSLTIFGFLGLLAYAFSYIIESIPTMRRTLTHEEYLKTQEKWAEYDALQRKRLEEKQKTKQEENKIIQGFFGKKSSE